MVLLLIPVQTLFFEKIGIGGIRPDFSLILVLPLAWHWGQIRGLLWGLLIGGVLDVYAMGILGINFVFKGLLGLLSGFFGKVFLQLTFRAYCLLFFLILFFHDFSALLFLNGFHLEETISLSIGKMLVQTLYNTVFSVGFFMFMRSKMNKNRFFENEKPLFPFG